MRCGSCGKEGFSPSCGHYCERIATFICWRCVEVTKHVMFCYDFTPTVMLAKGLNPLCRKFDVYFSGYACFQS